MKASVYLIAILICNLTFGGGALQLARLMMPLLKPDHPWRRGAALARDVMLIGGLAKEAQGYLEAAQKQIAQRSFSLPPDLEDALQSYNQSLNTAIVSGYKKEEEQKGPRLLALLAGSMGLIEGNPFVRYSLLDAPPLGMRLARQLKRSLLFVGSAELVHHAHLWAAHQLREHPKGAAVGQFLDTYGPMIDLAGATAITGAVKYYSSGRSMSRSPILTGSLALFLIKKAASVVSSTASSWVAPALILYFFNYVRGLFKNFNRLEREAAAREAADKTRHEDEEQRQEERARHKTELEAIKKSRDDLKKQTETKFDTLTGALNDLREHQQSLERELKNEYKNSEGLNKKLSAAEGTLSSMTELLPDLQEKLEETKTNLQHVMTATTDLRDSKDRELTKIQEAQRVLADVSSRVQSQWDAVAIMLSYLQQDKKFTQFFNSRLQVAQEQHAREAAVH